MKCISNTLTNSNVCLHSNNIMPLYRSFNFLIKNRTLLLPSSNTYFIDVYHFTYVCSQINICIKYIPNHA